jgi:hypothetical protein
MHDRLLERLRTRPSLCRASETRLATQVGRYGPGKSSRVCRGAQCQLGLMRKLLQSQEVTLMRHAPRRAHRAVGGKPKSPSTITTTVKEFPIPASSSSAGVEALNVSGAVKMTMELPK